MRTKALSSIGTPYESRVLSSELVVWYYPPGRHVNAKNNKKGFATRADSDIRNYVPLEPSAMAGMTSNSGISPLFDRWITDEWLTSTRGSRFLLIAARLHVVCLLIFLLFLPPARPWLQALLRHLGGRIAFGLGGALAALTAMILVNGMRKYWQRIDDSSKTRKKLWFWILTLGVNIGACAYCFLVYWPQRRSAEAMSDP